MGVEQRAVRRGIREDEHDNFNPAITSLEGTATLDSLNIARSRLDLYCDIAVEERHPIPRPKVAQDRERHLGSKGSPDW